MIRVLVLLALLGAAVAVPKKINRIVGGEPTTIEQFPYMANMQFGWFSIWWYQACGGSVITNNAVLSAAHCYEGDSPSEWRVRVESTFADQGTEHAVSQLILHAEYSARTLDNDIAIIKLATPIVFSNQVQPARIAGSNYQLSDGAWVTTIGWGHTTQGGSSSNVLQSVEINVINQELCAERYAYLKTQPGYQNWPDITPRMLCAGILDVGGKDACQGDSGGPLAHSGDVLVGIVSWGLGCADAFYPGVNARVASFTDWIIANA